MENKRSKVLISILLVVLCLSVCVGLTYAYFTDSAKSSGNKIQAGNLKLDLKLYDKVDGWQSIKNSEAPIFNYDKWEPGYVDAKLLKIENLGDLAMQWEAKLVSTEAVSEFANAIEVYVQKSDTEFAYPADRAAALAWTKVGTLDQFINTAEKLANGTFTAQGEAYYIGIAFYMPAEITDNTLQGKVLGAFDIQINATQYTYESDAFDEKYDENAKILCDHLVTETVAGRDATCSTAGLSEGERCVACGEMTVEQQPTSTIPHTAGEWLIDVEPTPDAEGSKYALCTVCGEEAAREAMQYSESIFTWSLNADRRSYTVTGLKDSETVTEFVVPNTYNGFPVIAIGNEAFRGDEITKVTVEEGITTIGDYAFAEACTPYIMEITLPSSITAIGSYAFKDCGRAPHVQVTRFRVISTYFNFAGTLEQWNQITFGTSWCKNIYSDWVQCMADGQSVQLPYSE